MIKKYQVLILIIFEILSISVIIPTIFIKKNIEYIKINNIVLIMPLIILGIYIYISRKFWKINNKIYKIFSILNVIYILNIIGNIIMKEILHISLRNVPITNIPIVILLIGNIILLIRYNKNVQNLKYKLDT